MTTVYAIENCDTGDYYNHGEWAEEAEWFDTVREALDASRALALVTPSPTVLRRRELEQGEFE